MKGAAHGAKRIKNEYSNFSFQALSWVYFLSIYWVFIQQMGNGWIGGH
jgi:hypothetical protein